MPWIGVTFLDNGADRTELTPTINIYDMSNNSKVINAAAVPEIAEGGYKYDFSTYDASKNYYWKMDAGAAVPNRERYRRGWTGLLGAVPDAQAGINGGLPTVDANDYIAGIQGTKNVLDNLNDLSAAQVNAEMVDTLNVDTYAEPGQGTPPATTTLVQKIGYIFKFWRNKNKRSSGEAASMDIYNAAGDTVDQKSSILDDGTTFEKGEYESGP